MVAFCELKAICRWKLCCSHSLHFSSITYAWRATMKTTQFKRCQKQVNCWDFSPDSQNLWRKPPEIIQKGRNTTSKFYFCVVKYYVFKMSILGINEKGHSIIWELTVFILMNWLTSLSSSTASDSHVHNCREPTNKILFWELQTHSSFIYISMGANNQTAKTQNKI